MTPDLKTSLDLCTFCPRLCSHTCPVSLAEARETVTPQVKMATLAALRRARGDEPSAAPLYACTGCGACTEACLHHVEPGQALLEGRGLSDRLGQAPPVLSGLPARHRRFAAALAAVVRRAVPPHRRKTAAGLSYLPGCLHDVPDAGAELGDADPGPGEDALRALRVLDRLGLPEPAAIADVSLLDAGYPLYAAGLSEPFRLYAEVFAREIEGHGTLALGCPACAWLLRTQYRRHGVPVRPRIVHISEVLAPLSDRLQVATPLLRAVYHDPCYLSRHLRVTDEPRQVLRRAVAELQEFPQNRAQSTCCGAGGLLPLTAPATAAAIAGDRLAELDAPGAPAGASADAGPVIVTACPSCQRHLGAEARRRGGVVLGLLEVLDRDQSLDQAEAALPRG